MSLLNKVAIVTGASSGIGAAVAKKFIKEGAKVTIVGRNETKLKNVSEECKKTGGEALPIIADVTNDSNIKNIVDETVKKFGKIDVLVNNAGASFPTKFTASDAMKSFDTTIAVNLRAIVSLTNAAALHLIKSKGNIVNVSSISSIRPFISTGFAYNTSKAAVDHFTKTIAVELAKEGVRANVVNPGPVRTDIVKNTGADEATQEALWKIFQKGTVLNKIADPEEVADLILFLASDKARSITGASFVIDNGGVIKN